MDNSYPRVSSCYSESRVIWLTHWSDLVRQASVGHSNKSVFLLHLKNTFSFFLFAETLAFITCGNALYQTHLRKNRLLFIVQKLQSVNHEFLIILHWTCCYRHSLQSLHQLYSDKLMFYWLIYLAVNREHLHTFNVVLLKLYFSKKIYFYYFKNFLTVLFIIVLLNVTLTFVWFYIFNRTVVYVYMYFTHFL